MEAKSAAPKKRPKSRPKREWEGGERVVTTAGRATARRALGLGSIDC